MVNLSLNKNQQAGFSIISVVIAGTLLSILSLGASNLIVQQFQAVAFLEDKIAQNDLKMKLTSLFSNNEACENTLKGKPIKNTQDITSIRNENNTIEFNTAGSSQFEKILIKSLKIVNIDTPNSANSTGQMKVVVDLSREREGGGPSDFKPLELIVAVNTGVSSKISSCSVLGGGGGSGGINAPCGSTPSGATIVKISGDDPSCWAKTNYICVHGILIEGRVVDQFCK